ncbi:hypothetical protein [Rhizobium herbae]|uniref:Uncharacterized protein n=1 Tax=Rhizobium herbae TaxID=508661 RepID=A0ABS4ESP2_9HYPH|nr:hypothetical protein [Rhizobium herbae]MBP1860964.1 hypothetical protein [Rhizobium herbae]
MRRVHVLAGLVLAILQLSPAVAAADPFDKPIAVDIVKLPADPDNPSAEPKITCRRYRDFMVKEVDLGEVGAETLALMAQDAACGREGSGERVIRDDTAGYFLGVAGRFVFFRAADGWNGGLSFVVYDGKTAMKLFADSLAIDSLSSINAGDDRLSLQFHRNFTSSCSLYAAPQPCAKQIGTDTGLDRTRIPDCAAAYEAEMKRTPDYAEAIKALPSVIEYPVELRWAANGATVTPRDGPTRCMLPS